MRGEIKYRKKYNLETCESVEVKVYVLDGKEVTEAEFLAAFPEQEIVAGEPPGGPALSGWPILSDALAVHRKRIPEAEESARKRGVPTEFVKKDGRPIFRDRSHRRAYLKAYKYIDLNSYNGY